VTYILGLNAYHGDSSACLVKDGLLVAAAEEERFRRIKHWAGFPSEAIRYCLAEAKIGLDDVGHVAINQDFKANLWRKIGFTLSTRPDLGLVFDRIKNKKERASLGEELARTFKGESFAGKVHEVEHHLAHLGSAFLVSPFDDAVVVSVDGFGDFASAAWGLGSGSEVRLEDKVLFPHSLGIFYQALTQYIGFPNYGDEYKVMGLAPYGEPKYLAEMRRIVQLQDDGSYRLNLDYFLHHKEKTDHEWVNGEPRGGCLFSEALSGLLGPARGKGDELMQNHKDIARSVQAMYEEAFFHLLNTLYKRYGLDRLALAGGCAMNSVANGKIALKTPFKKIYVQSAAGDAGGAIGAALVVWNKIANGATINSSSQPLTLAGAKGLLPKARSFIMDHAYWGPQFTNVEIGRVLQARRDELGAQTCVIEEISDDSALCQRAAQAIANAKVVGWFQGRMEWGPRALGNRSILGDPRRADMKDILNIKIKRRESFRPFAPSILREAVSEWFEMDEDVPFMMQVFQIKKDKRALIPAVTHVDGSGRLQTVHRDANARYYLLIEKFYELTGVPMVLNTSFNENEPVVCHSEEALDCFLRTKMDVLFMGNWVITRDNG
jgi:carbamoyltransferase